MTNITTAVTLLAALAVGAGIGGFVAYDLTAQVNVTCPISAQTSNPPDFFKSTPLPTTGGKRY